MPFKCTPFARLASGEDRERHDEPVRVTKQLIYSKQSEDPFHDVARQAVSLSQPNQRSKPLASQLFEDDPLFLCHELIEIDRLVIAASAKIIPTQ